MTEVSPHVHSEILILIFPDILDLWSLELDKCTLGPGQADAPVEENFYIYLCYFTPLQFSIFCVCFLIILLYNNTVV